MLGIINVRLALVLPVSRRVRAEAQLVACQHNLRQSGGAMLAWAADHDCKLPDKDAVGASNYRMRPGLRTPEDRSAAVETYGLAAVLHGIRPGQKLGAGLPPAKYLPADGGTWVCPSASDLLRGYENTYAFATTPATSQDKLRLQVPDLLLAWDNHTLRPALSGQFGGSPNTIKPADQQVPHRWTGSGRNGARVELQAGMNTRVFPLKD